MIDEIKEYISKRKQAKELKKSYKIGKKYYKEVEKKIEEEKM